jgi:hypothetical protein
MIEGRMNMKGGSFGSLRVLTNSLFYNNLLSSVGGNQDHGKAGKPRKGDWEWENGKWGTGNGERKLSYFLLLD